MLIKSVHSIHIILQAICLQCKRGVCKRRIRCQPVKIDNITWFVKDNCGIAFFAGDSKNRILTSVDNDGIGDRLIHTEQEIKIIVHGVLLPTIFCTIKQVNNSYKHIRVFGLTVAAGVMGQPDSHRKLFVLSNVKSRLYRPMDDI